MTSASRLDWLSEQFDANRPRLRAIAFRILGSSIEAEDALQDAWLKLHRTDADRVDNLAGWLTTVVARVSLDMLRARKSRKEEIVESPVDESAAGPPGIDPEAEAILADSVGQALLIVLETLGPHERLAFVLHDMFDVPFDEIAAIIGRSPDATRQLASRARRRVRGVGGGDDIERRREVVGAFLAAARSGDFEGLLNLLAPNVVMDSDAATVALGSPMRIRSATEVAKTFSGRAKTAEVALIDGLPGLVWAPGGRTRAIWLFDTLGGRVTQIVMITDRDRIARLAIQRSS